MVQEPIRPFQEIMIDFGTVYMKDKEEKYFILAVDRASGYVVGLPTKTLSAEDAGLFLYFEIYMRFGLPEIIRSDRGTHFTNKMIKESVGILEITHKYSVPHHPESAGLIERQVQEVKKIIQIVTVEAPEWPLYFYQAIAAINWTPKKNRGNISPHEYLMGYNPRISEEMWISSRKGMDGHLGFHEPTLVKEGERRIAIFNRMREAVNRRRGIIRGIREANAACHLPMESKYQDGDLVMIYSDALRPVKGRKKARYYGPYVITKVLNYGSVILQLDDGEEIITNGNFLLPYKSQDAQEYFRKRNQDGQDQVKPSGMKNYLEYLGQLGEQRYEQNLMPDEQKTAEPIRHVDVRMPIEDLIEKRRAAIHSEKERIRQREELTSGGLLQTFKKIRNL
jgi:hypothetical protein